VCFCVKLDFCQRVAGCVRVSDKNISSTLRNECADLWNSIRIELCLWNQNELVHVWKKDNDHQTYWTQIHKHQNLHLLCYNLLDYKYGVFLFLGYKNWVIVNDFKIIKPFKILDLLECSIIALQSGQQSRLQMRWLCSDWQRLSKRRNTSENHINVIDWLTKLI